VGFAYDPATHLAWLILRGSGQKLANLRASAQRSTNASSLKLRSADLEADSDARPDSSGFVPSPDSFLLAGPISAPLRAPPERPFQPASRIGDFSRFVPGPDSSGFVRGPDSDAEPDSEKGPDSDAQSEAAQSEVVLCQSVGGQWLSLEGSLRLSVNLNDRVEALTRYRQRYGDGVGDDPTRIIGIVSVRKIYGFVLGAESEVPQSPVPEAE
jgi:hypothetical protein